MSWQGPVALDDCHTLNFLWCHVPGQKGLGQDADPEVGRGLTGEAGKGYSTFSCTSILAGKANLLL